MKPTYEQLETQVKQLEAENAALKLGVKYFSYSEMSGFEEHGTAELALKSADADLAGERDEASSEGWSEETDTICWGVILQKAIEDKFESPSEENGWIGWSNYTLLPSIETPATDAYLSQLRDESRAEGAYFVANRMLAAWDAGFIEDTARNAADIARMILTSTEFMTDAPEGDFDRSFADGVLEDIARQLREGKAGEVQS